LQLFIVEFIAFIKSVKCLAAFKLHLIIQSIVEFIVSEVDLFILEIADCFVVDYLIEVVTNFRALVSDFNFHDFVKVL
jgi:hypothetical protein